MYLVGGYAPEDGQLLESMIVGAHLDFKVAPIEGQQQDVGTGHPGGRSLQEDLVLHL